METAVNRIQVSVAAPCLCLGQPTGESQSAISLPSRMYQSYWRASLGSQPLSLILVYPCIWLGGELALPSPPPLPPRTLKFPSQGATLKFLSFPLTTDTEFSEFGGNLDISGLRQLRNLFLSWGNSETMSFPLKLRNFCHSENWVWGDLKFLS